MIDLMMCCWGILIICALPFAFVLIVVFLYYTTFIIVAFMETVSNVVSAIFGKRGKDD